MVVSRAPLRLYKAPLRERVGVQLDAIHIETENYGVPIAAIGAWLAAHRPEVRAQIEAGQS